MVDYLLRYEHVGWPILNVMFHCDCDRMEDEALTVDLLPMLTLTCVSRLSLEF